MGSDEPEVGNLSAARRNTATWNVRGQTAASDRFNYDYSEAELQGFLDPVRRLASQVDDLHVVFNNNNEDQGQRNARTLMAMTTDAS